MELNKAEIILKSRYNDNTYYLFENTIVIEEKNGKCTNIPLPKKQNVICFYDMYYAEDGLRIIIATRDSYDIAGILDEYSLIIDTTKLTK